MLSFVHVITTCMLHIVAVCACGSPKSFIPLAGGVSTQRLHAVFVQRGAPAKFPGKRSSLLV